MILLLSEILLRIKGDPITYLAQLSLKFRKTTPPSFMQKRESSAFKELTIEFKVKSYWIPTFAGMTNCEAFGKTDYS